MTRTYDVLMKTKKGLQNQAQLIKNTCYFATKTEERRLTRMSDNKNEKKNKERSTLKDIGWFALKTTAISGAVLGGTAIALPAIGFTAGGVAAGSLAASFQSAYLGGTIASGSAFALLQSAGAAGLAASTQAAVVAASAAFSGAHTVFKNLKKTNETDRGNTSEEPSESDMEDDEKDEPIGKNDDKKGHKKISKSNNFKGLNASRTKNDNTGKNDKTPVKLVISYRNDDTSNTQSPNDEDEILKKWENAELSKDLTITINSETGVDLN